MNTKSVLRRSACVVALSFYAGSPTFATDSGFYLGFNLGQSKFDVPAESTGAFDITTGPNVDDSDTGFSVSFGYRFNPYFGAEISFMDLGEFAIKEFGQLNVTRSITPPIAVPTRPALGVVDVSGGGDGIALAVVGSLPLGSFEISGRVGALFATSTLDVGRFTTSSDSASTCTAGCTWAFPNAGSVTRTSTSTTEALFALGAGYTFSQELNVKLEWMRVPNLGDKAVTGETDVDNISIGIQYRFD